METQPMIGRPGPDPRALLDYAIALVLVAIAVLVTLGMRALSPFYFSFFAFYVAIFVAGWHGGYGAGLLAALLAALAVNAFFVPPVFSLMPIADHLPRVAAFVISAVIGATVSARQRNATEALRQARDSLEERVRERTREVVESRQRLDIQIRARDRAVEALRLILDVSEAAGSAPSPTAAAGACLKKICDLKALPFAQAWFRDEQQDRLICSATAVNGAATFPELRAVSLETPLAKGQGLPGRVWQTGGPIWSRFDETSVIESHVARGRPSEDGNGGMAWEEKDPLPASLDMFPRALARLADGVHSGVAFPIFVGGKLLAVFEFIAGERLPLDEAFLDAVDKLGRLLGDVLERKRVEEAQRAGEERWRTVFEMSSVGITTSDGTRYYTSANKAFQKMVGYSEAELRALQSLDLTHEDDREASRVLIDELRAGRRDSFELEKRYRRKDGEAIWVNVYCSHVPGSEAMPGFYQAVIIDITERKRAEAALRASVARWRTVFATASVGIAMSDGQRRITSANAALQRMLGYSEAELCALKWDDLTPEDDRALTRNWVSDLERGRERSYQVEKRYRRKDGDDLWASVNASYVPAIEAAPAFFVSIIVDIHERKQAEAALRRNEEQWRSIYEQAPVGIIVRSPDGHPLAMNPAFEKLVGYTLDEMKAHTFDEITHPDDLVLYHEYRPRVASGETVQFEKRYLHKNGQAVPVIMTVSNFSGTESMPPGRLGIVQDITERKRAEDALRASEERWRNVFEHSPTAIATVGPDWRLTSANPACQRMLGYGEDELKGMTSMDFSHDDDRELTRELLSQLAGDRQSAVRAEKRYRRKDGAVVWGDATLFRVPGTADAPAFLTAMVVDISEQKRTEERLARAQAELARVARVTAMGELVTSIAHEINQPLAAIVASGGACHRWLAGKPANLARAKESLDRIVADANRASEVIRRIRSHARNAPPEPTLLDVNDIVREVLAFVRADLLAKQVAVRTELIDAVPRIRGDRVQLQQVLLNLVMNGVEAMAGIEGRRPTLTIRSGIGGDGEALVTVEDSGVGLSMADAERIFDAFFTTKPNGMGMGLSISTSIIEAHGGRLWASPAVPHGTAFHFRLPAVPGNEAAAKAASLHLR